MGMVKTLIILTIVGAALIGSFFATPFAEGIGGWKQIVENLQAQISAVPIEIVSDTTLNSPGTLVLPGETATVQIVSETTLNSRGTLVPPGETVTVEVQCFNATNIKIGNVWVIKSITENATRIQSNIPGLDTGGVGVPTSIRSGDSLKITVTNSLNLPDLTIGATQVCAALPFPLN